MRRRRRHDDLGRSGRVDLAPVVVLHDDGTWDAPADPRERGRRRTGDAHHRQRGGEHGLGGRRSGWRWRSNRRRGRRATSERRAHSPGKARHRPCVSTGVEEDTRARLHNSRGTRDRLAEVRVEEGLGLGDLSDRRVEGGDAGLGLGLGLSVSLGLSLRLSVNLCLSVSLCLSVRLSLSVSLCLGLSVPLLAQLLPPPLRVRRGRADGNRDRVVVRGVPYGRGLLLCPHDTGAEHDLIRDLGGIRRNCDTRSRRAGGPDGGNSDLVILAAAAKVDGLLGLGRQPGVTRIVEVVAVVAPVAPPPPAEPGRLLGGLVAEALFGGRARFDKAALVNWRLRGRLNGAELGLGLVAAARADGREARRRQVLLLLVRFDVRGKGRRVDLLLRYGQIVASAGGDARLRGPTADARRDRGCRGGARSAPHRVILRMVLVASLIGQDHALSVHVHPPIHKALHLKLR
mmetsp:Transcript_59862/g.177422  ORF Transcript_59862/g.177422 Transcript_59862/m.177422 type:complete len:458 (-) Transcript_59862:483-1856(-)